MEPCQVRAIATPEIGCRPRNAFRLQTQDSKIKNFVSYQLVLVGSGTNIFIAAFSPISKLSLETKKCKSRMIRDFTETAFMRQSRGDYTSKLCICSQNTSRGLHIQKQNKKPNMLLLQPDRAPLTLV